jgi:hypothetical protein
VEDDPESGLSYRLCPQCGRAVPATSKERYCINDGSWLLEACPICTATVRSPYARHCGVCGFKFSKLEPEGLSPQDFFRRT